MLPWLARLRWFAVGGQLTAVAAATAGLGLRLPLHWIALVIGVTAGTNLLVMVALRRGRVSPAVVPALLLLDVALLTALLLLTGGPANPFVTLYIVHVGMAVAVLGGVWPWLVVVACALGYALLHFGHVPLGGAGAVNGWKLDAGRWMSLVLVGGLIAYFGGRIAHALRQREEELVGVRERAARSEQLATLTTLSAGAAHELGTPLGTIAVVAKEMELALASLPHQEPVADDARLIREQVDRCRAILDRMRVDLIDESSRQVGTIEIEQLLRDGVEPLPEGRRRRLRVTVGEGIRRVRLPVRGVELSLRVLLHNAFDASGDDAEVRLDVARVGGDLCFEVCDRGTGMAEEVLRQAGQPFFSTKGQGEGMGLGLFIVRLVAERAGGTFELQSRAGEGTKATLRLPEGGMERHDENTNGQGPAAHARGR